MRRTLLTAALLAALTPAAHAQQTRTWGQLKITLETCFRASSGTDVGCNVVVTNTGAQGIRVALKDESASVTLAGGAVTGPRQVVFGGASSAYAVTQIVPAGISVRAQLNYDVAKGVTTLAALRVGDAEFRDVPLAKDLPDEPAVNVLGTTVTSDGNAQLKLGFLDCVRGGPAVTCSFVKTSLADENLRVSSSSTEGTWLVTRRGLIRSGTGVTLGGAASSYTANSVVPARRSVLNTLTFSLDPADTFVPYLQIDNYVFRNLPITAQAGARALNAPGTLVDSYRLRDYAGKVDACSYVREGLSCTFTFTNRTDTGYRLTVDADQNALLTSGGEWFSAQSLTSGATTSRYEVAVPMPAGQTGTFSVLYAPPPGLTTLPSLTLAGLEFENVPVK